jgi:S1-C subfamily serine protease
MDVMIAFLFALAAVGQNGQVESADFPKQVQASALRATVRIVNGTTGASGSGVIVKQDTNSIYVLTAWHVVEKAEKVEVHTFSAESYPKAAKVYGSVPVVAQAKEQDLAVVRIATRDQAPGVLPLGPAAKAPVDKDFPGLSVGCNDGKAPTCRLETVKGRKAVKRPGDDPLVSWEVGAAPAAGRSGGPLVDKRGKVIGIASGGNDGLGYFVHVEEIERFLKNNVLEDLLEEDKK